MAYLDFSTATPPAAPAVRGATPPLRQRLTALEWTVVALARKDRPASLAQPGRIARALGGLFGFGAASRLADERLEALRRLAVRAWHQAGGVSATDRSAFLAAGYTADQLGAVLDSVARSSLSSLRKVVA